MSILEILQYPDLRLRRKGYLVSDVKSTKIQKIIADMVETLNHTENCAGLAATQLNIDEPPNITVINSPDKNHGPNNVLCLINLQIIKKEGNVIDHEGCMSILAHESVYYKVKRAERVWVSALNQDGNKVEFEAADHLARCLQHEHDHLQGILYIDHLSKLNRSRIEKKIAKLTRLL